MINVHVGSPFTAFKASSSQSGEGTAKARDNGDGIGKGTAAAAANEKPAGESLEPTDDGAGYNPGMALGLFIGPSTSAVRYAQ